MKGWLDAVSGRTILALNALSLLVVVVGTIEVTIEVVRALIRRAPRQESREVWIHYARWLVAGLTFLLAADVIETSINHSWENVRHMAAIAVIRTFVSYSLTVISRRLGSETSPTTDNPIPAGAQFDQLHYHPGGIERLVESHEPTEKGFLQAFLNQRGWKPL